MSAIIAKDLGKCYRRYRKPIDSLKELIFRKQYHEPFWALQEASFRNEPGEVLGIVGDNGAGKSTLLKLLAGTMLPTHGNLQINGRVSAILELGSGFHPDYTGLENIHLSCSMLGLSAGQINEKIDEIIEFSELGDFIGQPVKNYSSGMFVRLAFSVVTSVDPEILVVDEALSVGDQHFQKKSMDRMMAFREQGKSLVFCSHNLYHVKELCKRAIWLDKGRIAMQGESGAVMDQYNDHIRAQNSTSVAVPAKTAEATASSEKQQMTAYLQEVTLLDADYDSDGIAMYRTGANLKLQVRAHRQANLQLEDVHIGVVINRNDGVQCFGVSTAVDGVNLAVLQNGELGIIYEVPELNLLSGLYNMSIWLIDATSAHVYDSIPSCCEFKVRQPNTEIGVIYIKHSWCDIPQDSAT